MFRTTYKSNALVKATYPSFINYSQITIDDEKKTIINAEGELLPFIEITDEQHKDNIGKTMCVKNGVYQEFIKPDSELLQEAKDSKISEIKANRKEANQKDLTSIQANEIMDNGNGSFTTTTNLVDFAFKTKRSEDELTSPSNLLNACLRGNTIRYSCDILNPSRKGYVEMTPTIAGNMENHLIIRGESNVVYANNLEKEINDCTTVIEVNNINIDFS